DAATRGQFSDGSLPGDLANETIETMSGIGDAALEIAGSGRRRDMIDQVDPALLREAAPLFEHALSTRDLSKLDEFMDHHFPDDGSQAAENQRTAFLVRMALDRNGDQSEARQLGGAWSDIRVMRPGGRQDYANAEHFLLQGTYGASEYTGEVLNGAVMPAVYNLGKEVAGSPVDVFGVEPETITELHKNWTGVKDEAAAGEFSDGTFLGDLRNAAIEKVAQVMQLATTPMGSEPSLNQYAWQMAGFNQGRQSRDN
ncbi:MAG: hypothetical protein KC777_05795, partial [Cyanobacteria bacterium HKST-UBA02]|nr:hypothetical protein [Cyanobacteria bacterium HKST-UBA02]